MRPKRAAASSDGLSQPFGLANVIPGSRAAKMPPRSNDSAENGRAGGDVTGRLVRDLRTAWRGLLRARGLSLAAMISLAIGIGANLTAFALLRAVEFAVLPYHDASRLLQIDAANESRQARGYPLSLPDYDDLRARSSVFSDLGVSVDRAVTLDDGREPVRLSIKSASASYFTTLGVQPELGRAFTAVDIDGGTFTLIVLSHRVWTERYGRDPQLVGRTVRLDRTPFTVIGVMPSQFDENVEAWIPLVTDLRPTRDDRRYLVVGRLAPGATIERAHA